MPPPRPLGLPRFVLFSVEGSATNESRLTARENKKMPSGSRRITSEEEQQIRNQLAELRQEHRDLDTAIDSMVGAASPDTIRVQRLKKRKLALKDRIAALADQLLPDIIA